MQYKFINIKKMSSKKEVKKKVFLDFRSALLKLERERGIKKNLGSISDESGFSRVAICAWGKEAPAVVGVIYGFLKENNLEFNDLVKEIVSYG